jgi:hypothetical protein
MVPLLLVSAADAAFGDVSANHVASRQQLAAAMCKGRRESNDARPPSITAPPSRTITLATPSGSAESYNIVLVAARAAF